MKNRTRLGFMQLIFIAIALTPAYGAGKNIAADPPDLRVYGVKIKVPDLDVAIDFYSGTLGFAIESKADYPNSVSLQNEGIKLILSKAVRNKMIDYPNVEQTILVFQTNDLRTRVRELQAKGVEFLLDSPKKVGVGIATKFRDPFGNVHSLLEQQVGDTSEFAEPRIYNVGFYLADISNARKFYRDLGFKVRTESYYPPALPLNHPDGSFAFMLHERAGLKELTVDYEQDAQTVIVYQTSDLNATMEFLKAKRIPRLHRSPQISPQGRFIGFTNPAGLASEIVELTGENYTHNSANTLRLLEGQSSPVAKIEDLAWLAGHWVGEGLGGISEEVWAPPRGNSMVGFYRLIKGGKVVFQELLNLVEESNSLVLKVKHFTGDFVAWEEKEEAVEFPLVRLGKDEAYFSGLTLRRPEEDTLLIYLVIGNREGERKEEAFRFRRQNEIVSSASAKKS